MLAIGAGIPLSRGCHSELHLICILSTKAKIFVVIKATT